MNMENTDSCTPATDSVPLQENPIPPAEDSAPSGIEALPAAAPIFKPLIACVMAALVPGLGHVVLRKWDRALVFMASIGIMFAFGLHLKGSLFSPDFSDIFSTLKFAADAGSGSLYWLCRLRGMGVGDPAAYTYAFGNLFIYCAGLLNMLIIVDAFDIALGRKP
jgi:hypothetical protein